MTIEKDKKLSPYTTFGVGGLAKLFVVVKNIQEAAEAVTFARKEKLPMFVLGGGSNVVISDEGFDGMVIKNEIKGSKFKENFLIAGAGENWDDVAKKAVEAGLEGIECLSGIPGSFGGAIVQNIGAYGQTLGDVVDAVEAIDLETGQIEVFAKNECDYSYRNSLFKKHPGVFLVTAATLKLHEINRGNTTYPSVKEHFSEKKTPPTLSEVREAVIGIRASKGMVIMHEYESYKSAGSFFKNPIITAEHYDKIQPLVKCPGTWYWVESDGIKVSAACLVTSAGFSKGQMFDAVQISPKQPLAIINPGSATAKDIQNLAEKIKSEVMRKFAIPLEEEIVYVGKIR